MFAMCTVIFYVINAGVFGTLNKIFPGRCQTSGFAKFPLFSRRLQGRTSLWFFPLMVVQRAVSQRTNTVLEIGSREFSTIPINRQKFVTATPTRATDPTARIMSMGYAMDSGNMESGVGYLRDVISLFESGLVQQPIGRDE